MHDTAYSIGEKFIQRYGGNEARIIVEFGSYDVNGSLRTAAPQNMTYFGIDMEHGPGVDLVIDPKQKIPIRDDFADIIISTSQFEHDSFFWNTFLEFSRLVKEGGYIYLSAPSNGSYHRYPQDAWRFYPDAGLVLADWARTNGFDIVLVESFIAMRRKDIWNDFVAIFRKGTADEGIAPIFRDFPVRNARLGAGEPEDMSPLTEDMSIIESLRTDLTETRREADDLRARLEDVENRFVRLGEEYAALKDETKRETEVTGEKLVDEEPTAEAAGEDRGAEDHVSEESHEEHVPAESREEREAESAGERHATEEEATALAR